MSASKRTRQAPGLKPVDCEETPAELVRGFSHLPGLVWLDSAGNLTPNERGISLIAAAPTEVLRGDLADISALSAAFQSHASSGLTDDGLPTGGLFGWVSYEGEYCFGVYPEVLVFDHARSQWFDSGDLMSCWRQPPPAKQPLFSPLRAQVPRAEYEAAVARIHDYIAAGDLYQVNLCQQFIADIERDGDMLELYEHLRAASPAPMAGYFKLGGLEIMSSSPESFLRISGREIQTRPIKGTRPRFRDPEMDQRSAYELRTSEKEISELVMITDLLRNDLGQCCEFGSVEVAEMLKLESYEQVHHLVSTVKGTLRPEVDALAALKACFPGGSITGAPKKRSMEVIQELEQGPRGIYTGSLGYLGFNGEAHFNIAIRTLVREGRQLHYHVGAGIVADSQPHLEYEETLHKAEGMRRALASFQGL